MREPAQEQLAVHESDPVPHDETFAQWIDPPRSEPDHICWGVWTGGQCDCKTTPEPPLTQPARPDERRARAHQLRAMSAWLDGIQPPTCPADCNCGDTIDEQDRNGHTFL